MKLCIDNRERLRIPLFEEYIKAGKSQIIDGIETDNYQSGDFFTKDMLVGIEYKRDDFVPSIFNDQLTKQLHELRENFQYPYLFIGYDGIIDTITNNPETNPEVIIGKLASVVARQKVTVMFVGDLLVPFTVKVIDRFYDGQTPTKETDYSPIRRKPKASEIRLDIISRIPHLGAKKGLRLLNHFDGSIKKISNATDEEILAIPGFGPKLVKEIKEIFK